MTRLVRTEFRKIFTTKLWWGMLLGAAAFAAIATIAQIASNGADDDAPPLDTAETQQAVFSSMTSAQLFVVVVGIIGITTEFRHFTSRPTFLIEPHRGKVIAAKLIAYGGLGVLYAAACAVVTVAIAVPWLNADDAQVQWVDNDVIQVLIGSFVTVTIWAIVGVGIGVLIPNQIVAVIGTVAYLFVLESLISIIPGIDDSVYKFLPGAASSAVTNIGHFNDQLLHALPGAIVFLAWGFAFALAGWWNMVRRDIP